MRRDVYLEEVPDEVINMNYVTQHGQRIVSNFYIHHYAKVRYARSLYTQYFTDEELHERCLSPYQLC